MHARVFDHGVKLLREGKHLPLIAKRLRIARQAPYGWDRVPADRCIAVSEITGIPAYKLRPDLYPKRKNGA